MDLDDEGRLKNMLWADPRSREAYKEFGEVVTFDTTYLTNKYAMPFAPFVGVNHHGESILFGCGLISSEDKDIFAWLFETWLTCMHGKAPEGIITDQDKAMQNAIEIVFPNTKHRWCLWHVMKKLPEKFRSYKKYEAISLDMLSVVYDSQDPEEFERDWSVFLEEYNLHENEWLTTLYDERHLWVPCFVKSHFWAGMSTTQRSESINAFFKDYVTSKTMLKQFVYQYEQATNEKVEKESQSDFKSHNSMLSIVTTYEYEVQVRKLYTTSKFKEFQDELTGMMYCIFMSSQENDNLSTYGIREDIVVGEGKKRMIFTISYKKDECVVQCNCCLYESRGILCRHALVVLIRNDVDEFPEKYILRRWRKDVSRSHTKVKVNFNACSATPERQRYDKMCSAFMKIAYLASTSEERCTHDVQVDVPVKKTRKRNNSNQSKTTAGTPKKPRKRNSRAQSSNTTPKKSRERNTKVESCKHTPKKPGKRSKLNQYAQDDEVTIAQDVEVYHPIQSFPPEMVEESPINESLAVSMGSNGEGISTGLGEIQESLTINQTQESIMMSSQSVLFNFKQMQQEPNGFPGLEDQTSGLFWFRE
ncbi:protein FAR-RED IMPAIRED RESPONSE 1-like [Papaver somniferum]|uniref:protein FAR-RED IMPAIRED RESPONSE 1-like n=1 Tax=Papaver somniferum TaxID=3469 RepID=UPI000E6FF8C7|nr:protein FAR-RED IMPAIRED RESPONSE 1-like [Papaver somniferum]